jgi:hypothetical protein
MKLAGLLFVLAVLAVVPFALAHGTIDQSGTWTNPPVRIAEVGQDSIFSEARYYVTETHAVVAMTTCLQIKKSDGSWGSPPVDYNCVSGRGTNDRGRYQSRYTDCAKDGVYRTRQWAHVEGDQGTVHLEHTGTSGTRTINCA